MKNLSYDGKLLNVPLFMIDELKRLITTIERKEYIQYGTVTKSVTYS